jgi:dTDP-4-dehydrorhamnose 3,5-epimerase
VFDVVVDIRPSSPTFGKWGASELTEENRRLFWVPPGFANGFNVLSPQAEFVYKCTEYHAP